MFGVVVTAVGLVATGPDDIAKAAGINVNLDAGIAMLVFAAGFAAWARLRPIAVPQEAQQEGEDASYQARFAYNADRYGATIDHLFVDPDAQRAFDELMEWLRNEVLGSYFRNMAQGMRDMGPEDRRRLADMLSELNDLIAGFMRIRDQEPLDDVSDWANAVIALLEDEARGAREG